MGVGEKTVSPYTQLSHSERLWEKTKKTPFVPLGIAAALGTVGYGAYSYKNRGTMSTSVFLMHLRVRAQSMIVGAMLIGVSWSLFNDYFKTDDKKTNN